MPRGLVDHRLNRIKQLLYIILKASDEGKVIDEEKLTGGLCFDWGTSRRTIKEYLKTLELALKIVRAEGEIFTYDKFQDLQAIKDMDAENIKKEFEGGNPNESGN